MFTERDPIQITPESELARFLDAGGETPVLLEKNGKLYRLVEEPQKHQAARDDAEYGDAEYDAEAVRVAIRRTTGSWSNIDPDKFIDDLYRAREAGSRPVTRP